MSDQGIMLEESVIGRAGDVVRAYRNLGNGGLTAELVESLEDLLEAHDALEAFDEEEDDDPPDSCDPSDLDNEPTF